MVRKKQRPAPEEEEPNELYIDKSVTIVHWERVQEDHRKALFGVAASRCGRYVATVGSARVGCFVVFAYFSAPCTWLKKMRRLDPSSLT